MSLCIAAALPRWRLRRAYGAVFLPETPLEPADDARVRALGAVRLAAASASAVGADPALGGKGAAEVLARRATAVLATAVGIPNSEVAYALGMHPIASSRLRHRPVDERVLRAARLRISLEDAVAAAPPVAHQPGYEPMG